MKKRKLFILITISVMFIVALSCGRKGPPFIPKEQVPHRVKELKGEWMQDDAVLSGKVGEGDENGDRSQEIAGCKVYYAWYPVESAPCEGCPISLRELKTIEGEVVTGRRFKCMVTEVRKKGIHYFKVGLIGSNGEIGPLSNMTKLISE